ncbi:MnhB domain-containing protein [Baekduia soli]|uniref:MnhB domain-containing protein n=1 Tax=Baekduia soli TaxID=496014 RepID=UPI001652B17F|nr:MnhB domain-containing protein [Baekduia soli]
MGTVALLCLGGLLTAAVATLPRPDAPPPRSALLSTSVSVHERHVTDTVAGITFDLRGVDTLGEELILFSAAIGVSVLLRAGRREVRVECEAEPSEARRSETPGAVRALAAALAGPLLVFAGYLVSHGHLTPGGGFQGGVILAAVALLVYVGGRALAGREPRPVTLVELVDAVGAAAFVLVALGGLVFAGAAMTNFLALGISGQLLSGGTILVLEVVVGFEVGSAMALILTELLDQALPGAA